MYVHVDSNGYRIQRRGWTTGETYSHTTTYTKMQEEDQWLGTIVERDDGVGAFEKLWRVNRRCGLR